jgi:hypothetical protein
MRKNKNIKSNRNKATLAEVVKEMAKPRVALSAREPKTTLRDEGLVVKNNVEK